MKVATTDACPTTTTVCSTSSCNWAGLSSLPDFAFATMSHSLWSGPIVSKILFCTLTSEPSTILAGIAPVLPSNSTTSSSSLSGFRLSWSGTGAVARISFFTTSSPSHEEKKFFVKASAAGSMTHVSRMEFFRGSNRGRLPPRKDFGGITLSPDDSSRGRPETTLDTLTRRRVLRERWRGSSDPYESSLSDLESNDSLDRPLGLPTVLRTSATGSDSIPATESYPSSERWASSDNAWPWFRSPRVRDPLTAEAEGLGRGGDWPNSSSHSAGALTPNCTSSSPSSAEENPRISGV